MADQTLALKAMGPLDLQILQGKANRESETDPLSRSQLETAATDRAQTTANTANINAEVPGTQATSQLKQYQLTQTLMANAAAEVAALDPNDPDSQAEADRIWARAGALGAGEDATQWVRKPLTLARQADLRRMYVDAVRPERAGAGEAGAGGAGNAAGGMPVDMTPERLHAQLDNMDQSQIPLVLGHQEQIESALQRVKHSANPSAQWDIEATRMGRPDLVGQYGDGSLLNQMDTESRMVIGVLNSRLMGSSAGLPREALPSEVKEANGALYQITPGAPGQPNAIHAVTPQGRETLVATTADGRGVYHNDVTGAERIGTTPLQAKPGSGAGGGRESVYEQKRQAWLDVHPHDDAGALAYAHGGAGARPMTAVQIQIAAAARADREVGADQSMGQLSQAEAEAKRAELTRQYVQEYTAAQAAGGADGGGAPDPAANLRAKLQHDWQASMANAASGPAGTQAAARRNAVVIERQAATALEPMPNPGPAPPPDSAVGRDIAEGKVTVAGNHTAWTKRNGRVVRLW